MQKFFSLILVVSLSAYSLNAQVIDKVKLRIHYATKFRVWENTKGMRQDEKVLDLGTTSSKFYSLWETRYWEIVDSVAKHGGSMQNALAHSPYPRSYDCYVVYKNYPIKGELTYTDKLLQDFIYQESMEKPVWRLVKGKDSIVANYRCQKAQTKYRGKVWNVWYTIDIPISDGPWKLYGLPGLILKAEDQDGNFVFECIQIENMNNTAMSIPKKKYLKCSREQLKQAKCKMGEDPEAYYKQVTGLNPGQGYDANGKPLKYTPRKPALLEY